MWVNGSGYHLWRMYTSGAQAVVGIDPTVLFLKQFELIKRMLVRRISVDVAITKK